MKQISRLSFLFLVGLFTTIIIPAVSSRAQNKPASNDSKGEILTFVPTWPGQVNAWNTTGNLTINDQKRLDAPSATITWTGLVNNSWDEPGNWSPATVPGTADDVIIPTGSRNWITANQNILCHNLDIFNSMTLDLGYSMNVSGNMKIHSEGKFELPFYGNIYVDGTLEVDGSMTLGGDGYGFTGISVTGNIVASGQIRLYCFCGLFTYSDLILSGSVDLIGGGITVENADISGNLGIWSLSINSVICDIGRIHVKRDLLIENSGQVGLGGGQSCFWDWNPGLTNGSVPGLLTVDGNIHSTGSFYVGSNATLITNGSNTGNPITISKYFCSSDSISWHFLSSPVTQQNICNGQFAPYEYDFSATPDSLWDFYKWIPGCPTPPNPVVNWRNLRTSTDGVNFAEFGTPPTFQVNKGYLVGWGKGFGGGAFTGTPNTGDQVCSFSDVNSVCSWELVGNPFPASIDWNKVRNKENLVNNFYYIWDDLKEGGPGFIFFSSGTINPCEGFFVKVKPDGGKTMVIPTDSRTTYQINNFGLKNSSSVKNNMLTVTLSNGTYYDQAYVTFDANSEAGQDRNDAEKMFSMDSRVPQVYTIVDNDLKTALNSLSSSKDPMTIPVGIVPQSGGNFSIKVTGTESFDQLQGLSLEDLLLNKTHDLLLDSVYTFSSDGTEDAGRFLLHFNGDMSNPNDKTPIRIFSIGNTINIRCSGGIQNGQVKVSNMLGQQILNQKLVDQTLNRIEVNAVKGYYIVKVQSDNSVKTAKIFIN